MGTNDIATRDQHVIEHFKNACENLQKISPELLADISTFIVSLSDSQKHTAWEMIADYLVSTMKVHLLSLMTTFQKNAEQDDIRPEHCKETLEEIFKTFHLLNEKVSIQSLDNLYTLTHIIGSLQALSKTTSASIAQNWLYDLVSMYHEELEEEHLVAKEMYTISIESNRQPVLKSFDFKTGQDMTRRTSSSVSQGYSIYLAS